MIADYLATYPNVTVELSLDDPYVDLLEKRFDLAIRVGTLADSSLIARKLLSVAMVPFASPAYLDKNGTPRVPHDLSEHNCLVYTFSTMKGHWSFVDRQGKEDVVRVSGRFSASNPDALLTLALQGAGIALAPDCVIAADVKAGRLIRLLPEFTTREIPVHAVYPHGQGLSAKTRTFIDFIAAKFNRSQDFKHDARHDENNTKNAA
jgi:DNA-binding transcriptional LysR family regulator